MQISLSFLVEHRDFRFRHAVQAGLACYRYGRSPDLLLGCFFMGTCEVRVASSLHKPELQNAKGELFANQSWPTTSLGQIINGTG